MTGTASLRSHTFVDPALAAWLDTHAEALHDDAALCTEIVPRLAQHGLFGLGVPRALGGSGGDIGDAIQAIAEVAQYSLAAAFVFWGQRTFIEYLLQSPNKALQERYLANMVNGETAGASGLSNAMKFLGGIEALQISAADEGDTLRLNGRMHWVTNLRKQGFTVAAAVDHTDPSLPPFIAAIPSTLSGVVRSDDLALIGLRSSNTAAIDLTAVQLPREYILHDNARDYLPVVRPAFLGLQCGMSIGLAQASLNKAGAMTHNRHDSITQRITSQQQALDGITQQLVDGVLDHTFRTNAPALFRHRINIAHIVADAVQIELGCQGGRAYLQEHQQGFLRRLTESAFIPIVTPSLSQLQGQLAQTEGKSH